MEPQRPGVYLKHIALGKEQNDAVGQTIVFRRLPPLAKIIAQLYRVTRVSYNVLSEENSK